MTTPTLRPSGLAVVLLLGACAGSHVRVPAPPAAASGPEVLAEFRAYSRAGFRVIGRRHEVVARGGRLHDLMYMDCLATEFESPALHRLMLGE